MSTDEQTISHLVVDEAQRVGDWNLCVGLGEVTKIVRHEESDGSLWFSSYSGDGLLKRINARYVVEVGYQQWTAIP